MKCQITSSLTPNWATRWYFIMIFYWHLPSVDHRYHFQISSNNLNFRVQVHVYNIFYFYATPCTYLINLIKWFTSLIYDRCGSSVTLPCGSGVKSALTPFKIWELLPNLDLSANRRQAEITGEIQDSICIKDISKTTSLNAQKARLGTKRKLKLR